MKQGLGEARRAAGRRRRKWRAARSQRHADTQSERTILGASLRVRMAWNKAMASVAAVNAH